MSRASKSSCRWGRSWLWGAALAAGSGALGGCLGYDPDCVRQPSAPVAVLETALDVRPATLRSGEAAAGDLIADAFYESMRGRAEPSAAVDLALIHAGAVSDVDECGRREALGPGTLFFEQLAALLPGDFDVELVRVTGVELLRALEHGAAFLGEPGPWGLSSRFLQVSHLRFQIDCAAPPGAGDAFVGARVSQVEVLEGGVWQPLDAGQTYEVATSSYLAAGAEGFVWLTQQIPLANSQRDIVALSEHLQQLAAAAGGPIAPAVDGRITLLESCD